MLLACELRVFFHPFKTPEEGSWTEALLFNKHLQATTVQGFSILPSSYENQQAPTQ